MDKNFDFTTMDQIIKKLETTNDSEMKVIVSDLIMLSRKAGHHGFTMKEIASLSTLGFIVSQEPELETLVNYLLSRTTPTDDILN